MTAAAETPASAPRGRSGSVRERPVRGRRAAEAAPARGPSAVRRRSAVAERAYARRRERWLRVIGDPGPGGASRTPFVLLVMGLLGIGLVSSLWLTTAATADSYQLQRTRDETRELAERVEQLRREVAAKEAAPALARAAEELGMVPVQNPAYLVVRPDGSVQVVGTPRPAAPRTTSAAPQAPAVEQPPPADAGQPAQDQVQIMQDGAEGPEQSVDTGQPPEQPAGGE